MNGQNQNNQKKVVSSQCSDLFEKMRKEVFSFTHIFVMEINSDYENINIVKNIFDGLWWRKKETILVSF